ncbi:MAG: methionyl-tRNA formyltransferase [bacterium]
MRIGWIGFHIEGKPALQSLLEQGVRIEAVITLRPELAARKSGAIDFTSLCQHHRVPLYEVANINDEASIKLLRELALDLAFVIGWSQIVHAEARNSVKIGMIGAHASFLPHNRGSAPINWALIKGEKQTGNSLIWLAENVDEGELIDQAVIPITPYDTCASLYQRVAESNREMILRILPKLLAGERPGIPQPHSEEAILPRRHPNDGLIDWTRESSEVYNLVRALTKPYPGAFSWLDGKRWLLWQCALLPDSSYSYGKPGEIVGQTVSPRETACGQMVACGKGAVVILEIEGDDGESLSGCSLSDQPWKGKVWANE